MANEFFDRVYGVRDAGAMRELYDDWAGSYDADLEATGYATPQRVAAALRAAVADPSAALLDFGCGTGLSGTALVEAGFCTIDGVDVSPGMLEQARDKGVYRALDVITADDTLADRTGRYVAIAAIGVIGAGAAPLAVIDRLWAILPAGGRLALSFNDHTLKDPAALARLEGCIANGAGEILFREHGEHLPGEGIGATVFVLGKVDR